MSTHPTSAQVIIIGGGIVGTAALFTLAHRGVDAILLETEPDLGYAASGTNSGILHTGFDSKAGELETELILRAARIRPAILEALNVPVLRAGAELVPLKDEDHEVIRGLADNARENGVEVHIRESDGALLVPGEWVSDPVAFTLALGASAEAAGARIERGAAVTAIADEDGGLRVTVEDGRQFDAHVVINAAGLYADEIARLVGDESFAIYPRKGEFFVFELPEGKTLDHIILPVPTKRTKGVLVFPTLDGKVIAGPTAVDLEDKTDWRVREDAWAEIAPKAVAQYPALEGLTPIASYAGLRPAGRDANYIIGPSSANRRLINIAAIRSTGLTASLGIADYVADLLPNLGVPVGEQNQPTVPTEVESLSPSWWKRTAEHRASAQV